MNRMNSRVDEIHEFFKTHIFLSTNTRKDKQVAFSNQLLSLRNRAQ